MKTLKEIAQTVLERRQRMSPTVMQGDLTSVIGTDGLKEALNRRWLVPNYESGYLQVSNDGKCVAEMLEIAAMPEPGTPVDHLSESREVCTSHAFRNACTVMEAGCLSEIAAPGTGKPAPSFVQTPATSSPTSAPSSSSGGGAPLNVGEDVHVVENGKSYQGKVKSGEKGRYRISFGGSDRPQDRDYTEKEISRVQAAK